MTESLRHIVILGDGVAGSMAAAALARTLSPALCRMSLVATDGPDDSLGPFGPAEASLPSICEFHASLGLDEEALLQEAGGSFALGVAYSGWAERAATYFTGFGEPGAPLDTVPFHQLVARLRSGGRQIRLGDYSLPAMIAQLGRFARPTEDPRSVLSSYSYGLHLPRQRYAAALRGLTRNVTEPKGVFSRAERSETGDIAALHLDTGERVEGDFFIDCSGPRGLLITGAPETGFDSWRRWLHCDRVVERMSPEAAPPAPYSHVETHAAGWQRTVPVRGGVGEAVIYCSDAAATEFEGGATFESGRRNRAWHRNCLALGASAATVEPLQPTSLHLVQTGLARFLKLFPSGPSSGPEAAEYNRQFADELDRLRDFAILRYKTNGRRGEPFWDRLREMPIPDPLAHKLALYESRGRIPLLDGDMFNEWEWAAALDDQGVRPRRYDPLADAIPLERLEQHLARLREVMIRGAATLPLHSEYLSRHGSRVLEPVR